MTIIKTAISIEEGLLQQVEQAAKEMKISRSSFFARALEEFLKRHENRQIVEKLNAVYTEPLDDEERAFLEVSRRQIWRLAENDPW